MFLFVYMFIFVVVIVLVRFVVLSCGCFAFGCLLVFVLNCNSTEAFSMYEARNNALLETRCTRFS